MKHETWSLGTLELDLPRLMDLARSTPRPSPKLRNRALARARASLLTLEAGPTVVPRSSRGRGMRLTLVVSIVFALGAIVAAVDAVSAMRGRATPPTSSTPPSGSDPVQPASLHQPNPPRAEARMVEQPTAPARRKAAGASPLTRDTYAAELDLLTRAQTAFARGEFTTALERIAEHERRFSSPRMAEEREALRVSSLLGAGRASEARRASAAFSVRFPRSVILPTLRNVP